MRAFSSSTKRLALRVSLGVASVILAPAACLYPTYTFNDPEPDGGTTSSTGSGSASSESCGDSSGAFACVSEAPEGWSGYYVLFEGPSSDDPGCPPAFPAQDYAGNAELAMPDPACPPCTCAKPTGETCELVPDIISNATCSFIKQASFICGRQQDLKTDGTCVATKPSAGGLTTCGDPVGMDCSMGGTQPCNGSITVKAATVTGGSCKESQTAKPFAVTSSKAGLACGGASSVSMGKACPGGQVCMPKAAAPYQPGVCIKLEGENTCPALFPKQHVFYKSFKDERSCDACTCGDDTGASCTLTMQFFGNTGCTGAPLAEVPSASCLDIMGNPTVSGRKAVGMTINQGSCTPSGGQVLGTVTPEGPTTFCCK
jgi:hypothetical protein